MIAHVVQPLKAATVRSEGSRHDHPSARSRNSANRVAPRYRAVTIAERPDLNTALVAADRAAYPLFMMHSAFAELWPCIYRQFPEYQLALIDVKQDTVLAHANSVPFNWDGRTASLPGSAIELAKRALSAQHTGTAPTALGALQAVVHIEYQGRGLSPEVLKAMAALAGQQHLADLFAPVRPSQKAHYPLIDMEDYVRWRRQDGLPQDPWIRVHHLLGAKLVGVPRAWATVRGSCSEWEDWTGMSLPQTGAYVVPGSLVPVRIDGEADQGIYEEPHAWMHYSLGESQEKK